ncbi:Appr-1-p processing protein [Hymenobacter gummosus]|uniref:Appr-1-p processing protein n=1 Tax=Hymenobacter gummosus TaxID=1776032 RepID=A0A431U291_9BACT|nr:macro domain-containing protein [Hymenobacter gummosus]RTQ49324.1 Appr-1-p processing protein [Hymenobacter gummosus]
MHYLLIDQSPRMVEAWRAAFDGQPNVEVQQGDLTRVSCDAIVSPANSFGFMDGGVDYAISERLGWGLQDELQRQIWALPEGELLVGRALVLETGDAQIPYLISAPTMRVPTNFNIPTSINAYLAMKAVLIQARAHERIATVAVPGMCTGVGRMQPEIAARQMLAAYCEIELGQRLSFQNFGDAQRYHWQLNPQGMIYTH